MDWINAAEMENENMRKQAIEKITMLLYQKGYRGKFSFGEPGSSMLGDVRACLDRFLERYHKGEYPRGEFDMEMVAPHDHKITCRFRLRYDGQVGFRIETFTVCNFKTNESQLFVLRNNNELPGSQAIYTLFPKPKPWDNIKKGKFRL